MKGVLQNTSCIHKGLCAGNLRTQLRDASGKIPVDKRLILSF